MKARLITLTVTIAALSAVFAPFAQAAGRWG